MKKYVCTGPRMVIQGLLEEARSFLANLTEAEILLSSVLQKPREFLVAHPEYIVPLTDEQKARELLQRRGRGEPVAYLTNHREFYGLDFYVDRRVLIPRPETEILVETVLDWVVGAVHEPATHAPRILDVGTGSGCLAVTLAKHLPQAQFTAVDISPAALEVAKINADRHGVAARIEFLQSDLLEAVAGGFFDCIVANLPYIGENENHLVSREVDEFEPKTALYGGPTGLELFEKMFRQLSAMSHKPYFLVCEIGFSQQDAIAHLIENYFPNAVTAWKNDLAGLPRAFYLSCDE